MSHERMQCMNDLYTFAACAGLPPYSFWRERLNLAMPPKDGNALSDVAARLKAEREVANAVDALPANEYAAHLAAWGFMMADAMLNEAAKRKVQP